MPKTRTASAKAKTTPAPAPVKKTPVNPTVNRKNVEKLLLSLRPIGWNWHESTYYPDVLRTSRAAAAKASEEADAYEQKLLANPRLLKLQRNYETLNKAHRTLEKRARDSLTKRVNALYAELTLKGPTPELCQRILKLYQSVTDSQAD